MADKTDSPVTVARTDNGKGTRLMDNKNLYPAMIGKLREMIADSTIQIAALQAQIDILAKENQRLTDQLNKDDNGNA